MFTRDSGKANGLAFDADGFLISCEGSDSGGRRVSRWNVKTGQRQTIVDNIGGKKFNAPNDLCLDSRGRIYFTDPRYLGDEPRELEHRAVYRIDKNGAVSEMTHEVFKPNGIALSPDERTLYVAEHDNGTDKIDPNGPKPKHGPMAIYAFPIASDGKVNGPARRFMISAIKLDATECNKSKGSGLFDFGIELVDCGPAHSFGRDQHALVELRWGLTPRSRR